MNTYLPTIGLEIHAELETQTKMFCACRNDADEKEPNTNICPVCMAHPGTLPVINKDAVRKVLMVGAALKAELADFTEFDRKNYFYPDIPKGYQISQYAYPLVKKGTLNGIGITRIHLEEDTARSQHSVAGVSEATIEGKSLVDYNRAGVPLMELVTEPDIHNAEIASSFARELQVLLRYLGSAKANMEKGEMRIEANISVSKTEGALGTKVEVKNLNSFKSVEKAIAFEIERQIKVLEEGGTIIQETRGWDEKNLQTFSQRKKESSEDYRYFPEPDLPKLVLSEIPEFSLEALEEALPKLPSARRAEYVALGLKPEDADMFVRESILGDFFDMTRSTMVPEAKLTANYILSDIAGKREAGEIEDSWLKDGTNADRFAELVDLIQAGKLSSRGAKDTLSLMYASTDSPQQLAESNGLLQQSDDTFITTLVQSIVDANPAVAAEFTAGKESALQFLVGQGMKESRGSANPSILAEKIKTLLKKP